MNTAELLTRRLEMVFQWYEGMVSPHTGMLEYIYLPQADTFVPERSPIRDLGSVWDVELLGEFLHHRELRALIERSLRHYSDYLVEHHGYLILDPDRLEEPSSIAQSAFMILALLHGPPPHHNGLIAALAEGILRQQRTNGSYQVYFDNLPDQGEELYAGEAMLALLETYRQMPDPRYLQSAERGFAYYDTHYFRRGRVGRDLLVFFANWQSQAGRRLFESTPDAALSQRVADYLFNLHNRIIEQGFYENVERHPTRQVSVEVACALEGLNDAYAVAQTANGEHAERYRQCLCTGLAYLLRFQCTHGGTKRERGGFGLSVAERAQRIDVTGHAASAFMKSQENRIECGAGFA